MNRFWPCIIFISLSCLLSISAAIDASLAQERQDVLSTEEWVQMLNIDNKAAFTYLKGVVEIISPHIGEKWKQDLTRMLRNFLKRFGEPSGTRTRDSLLKRSNPEQAEESLDDPSSQEDGEHE
jgi:hypothetical protein